MSISRPMKPGGNDALNKYEMHERVRETREATKREHVPNPRSLSQ